MKPAGMAAWIAGTVLAGSVMAGAAVLGAAPALAAGSSPSTTTVTASPTGAVVSDEPVTFTATVASMAPGGTTPTGDVTFESSAAGRTVCAGGTNTVPLVSGVASCTVDDLSAAASPVTIEAVYLGDATYATSNGQLSEVVTLASATTTVTASVNPPSGTGSGKPINFIATVAPVSPSVGTPTGDVVFALTGTGGGQAVCANGSTGIRLTRLHTAKCEIPSGVLVAVDSPWTITATYSGDDNFATSSGTYSQSVHPTTTQTHISSSPSPPAVSEALEITASVTVPKFAVVPTGDLTFFFATPPPSGSLPGTPPTPLSITCNGGTNTVGLTAGTNYATCTLPAGVEPHGMKYLMMATYSGDANNGSSSSNERSVLVH